MSLHDVPHALVELVTNAVSAFLLIVLFYILQHILDMHFECSCIAGLHLNGWLYLVAPSFIFTFVVQILELLKQKSGSFSIWHCLICNCCSSQLCSHLLKLLLKLFSMASMWISAVLFDGDWYYCLKTNYNVSQTGLPCKTNLTMEERRIKNGYRTESLDYGFYVLLGFLFLWSLIEMIKSYCPLKKEKWDCASPYYNVAYETYLAKEVTDYLHSELKKIAADKAKSLCDPHIKVIKKHELPQSDTNDGNSTQTMVRVKETWCKISECDFFLKEVTDSRMSPPTSPSTSPLCPPTSPPCTLTSPPTIPPTSTPSPLTSPSTSHPTSPPSSSTSPPFPLTSPPTSPLSPSTNTPSPLTSPSTSHPTSPPTSHPSPPTSPPTTYPSPPSPSTSRPRPPTSHLSPPTSPPTSHPSPPTSPPTTYPSPPSPSTSRPSPPTSHLSPPTSPPTSHPSPPTTYPSPPGPPTSDLSPPTSPPSPSTSPPPSPSSSTASSPSSTQASHSSLPVRSLTCLLEGPPTNLATRPPSPPASPLTDPPESPSNVIENIG